MRGLRGKAARLSSVDFDRKSVNAAGEQKSEDVPVVESSADTPQLKSDTEEEKTKAN